MGRYPNCPFVGVHTSIAGGMEKSVARAVELGCEVFQLFTHNQRQWAVPPLPETTVAAFRKALRQSSLIGAVAHASYLVNVASPDPGLWHRSLHMLREEVHRAARLGLIGVIFHPGSARGDAHTRAIDRVVRAVRQVLQDIPPTETLWLLVENTAGQGDAVGATLEEWWTIIASTDDPRVGGCLDTCHLVAAGYPIHTRSGYEDLMEWLERQGALERVRVVHTNDARKPPGSHTDRHEHIGDGYIGTTGFRFWMQDPRWHHAWMILETPSDPTGREDRRNLARLKALRRRGDSRRGR